MPTEGREHPAAKLFVRIRIYLIRKTESFYNTNSDPDSTSISKRKNITKDLKKESFY